MLDGVQGLAAAERQALAGDMASQESTTALGVQEAPTPVAT